MKRPLRYIIFVILFIAIGIAIPLSKRDNVERYSGAKQEAAKAALEMAHEPMGFPSIPFKFLKVTVEEVSLKCYHLSSEGFVYDKNQNLEACSPACLIKLGYWTFFGIKTGDVIFRGSNLGVGCS
jgi:hypothetical protein